MKKSVLGLFIGLILSCGTIFAQGNFPDEAVIEIKNPIIEGESANLAITMMKDGFEMKSYTGTVIMMITDEDGDLLNPGEYTLPNRGMYTFLPSDLGYKEFQKGLEIKKVGNFYIEIEDLDDETTLGKESIQVIKNGEDEGDVHIEVLNPIDNSIITREQIEVLAKAPSLPNSNVTIFIDNQIFSQISTDSEGLINHIIQNISKGEHSIKLEISDIEGNILGTSDTIFFAYNPQEIEGYKNIKIEPEEGLMSGDSVDVTIYTDEAVESVKLKLSDNSDDVFLSKIGDGEFSQKIFLISTGTIDLSIDVTAFNNSFSKTYNNIKTITIHDLPEVSNVQVNTDDENRTAEISWDLAPEISGYLINYRLNDFVVTGHEWTETNSFTFKDVPYDTTIYLTITPYVGDESDESSKHGSASQTIQFIIRKPADPEIIEATTGSTSIPSINNPDIEEVTPKCTIQNISTHTEKIGDNYYLIRDKAENVSKYIVYSSESPLGINRTKVYETTDTSYEYPFDYTAKEEQFMYFRIVGICDDGEELELSGATKVQVGPVQDFFLLLCMTLLIYFGIKLFRQTEE